ncbi:DNA repair protein RecN [Kineothrix sp. MB12-C1]|uniref:DNA repair protein RecN n=1 Tax=Kineothrix sp. MB12-C1 TaxID=3070215 RepID=UPI0027D2C4D8|nr:DNA repair protein RecN [Kineothrix sp. MB12-C1]WMC92930.1 DNA repair protein RecN [Kineothrix sp. MB12-C1]
MLVSLHVKNLALIDEEEVCFEKGLNILTGETGAGKSIIIGSVNLALGAKADKDLIRTGAEYALIELMFQLDAVQEEELRKMDIFPEEDGMLLIQRKIMSGRSVCKVCGETVSAKQLQEISGVLMDIHGQHEHQSLLQRKRHKEILDSYAKDALAQIKADMKEKYHNYQKIGRELKELNSDESAREKEVSLLSFEVKEIEDASLLPDEDITLEKRYRRMVNGRKIKETVSIVYRLTGYEEEESAGEGIGRALRELRSVSKYDETLPDMEQQLQDIDGLLNDFNRSLMDYMEELDFDEEDFIHTENRLNLINHLKSKYGKDIKEILLYKEEVEEKLNLLENYEAHLNQMLASYETVTKELAALCQKASSVRSKYAKVLTKDLKEALIDLNFENVEFEIQVRPQEGAFSAEGYDDVEFMISTNKGEVLKPLSQVASGGELSRIMLALKTVLADKDDIQTLIFDEIDTGISGKTAWKVSGKLGLLGMSHQVICITHLPQIAARADTHFLIEKSTKKGRTVTNIRKIVEDGSLNELARMLGGAEITEAALENAKEMKELARNTKQ